ncbi:MAG: glucose-6-phosphate dehydrogenase [Candidatus Dormibacteria bacterium]
MGLAPPPDQDIVVIGATGDLAARKLLPALYNLGAERLLPRKGRIIGAAPVAWSDDEFRRHARAAVAENSRTGLDQRAWTALAKRLRFVQLGKQELGALRGAFSTQQRLIYLAVPSSAFGPLIKGIGDAGLAEGSSVVIEKPFGHDARSAKQLNRTLHAVFPEERIFRIDHYLGKETVQNLLVFRFGNSVFERVWNRDAIDAVEITVAESLGVGTRGAFYEETGAIRDIVQNHLFQVLALVAMEPPTSFEAEALRNEKVKVLRAVHRLDPARVVRGQYAAGRVDGEPAKGYRDEDGVDKNSQVETYAALRLEVDTWRWSGVPFFLRTGKRMAQRETRITVRFRDVPLHLFHKVARHGVERNRVVIRVQPDEGISLTFIAKRPGPELDVEPVRMDFSYGSSFKTSPPEAYERLLHDALEGDHTLFIREDEVERGWEIVQPVLDHPSPVVLYRAGSCGPTQAEAVLAPDTWETLEEPTGA